MANPVVTNILKTGAICWIAPKGEVFPDSNSVAAGVAWGGNWTRLGFTKEPLKWAYEAEYHLINVEEFLSAIKKKKISEKSTIETVLSEITGDYLKYGTHGNLTTVAAGPSQVGKEVLVIGNNSELTEYSLGFEGIYYNANDVLLPIRFGFYICNLTLNGELTFSKREDDHLGIPLQAEALGDTSSTGRLVFMEKVTAPATS